ncbi:MAG: twin-arginine translocase TatA/TatE family subunit [Bdellovibrionales bacterium]|nr:twin-arginine translocase TatA/TatE family subunit [Bdellovibrionales bacterium]
MFNFGLSELILLGAIALIVIGPKQLPELARNLARFVNELKRATTDFRKNFTEVEELKNVAKELTSVAHDTEDWVKKKAQQLGDIEEEKPQPLKTGHVDNPNHIVEGQASKSINVNNDEPAHEGFANKTKKEES